MKFITENELRTRYSKEPFRTFILGDSFKLTPGARQFLNDFRIRTVSENEIKENDNNTLKSMGYPREILPKELAVMIKRAADKTYGLDKSVSHALNDMAIRIYTGRLSEFKETPSDFDFSESFTGINPGDPKLDAILDFFEIELKISELQNGQHILRKSCHDPDETKGYEGLDKCIDSIKSHLAVILNDFLKTESR